jgi:Domain of unknown function (DUF4911)
VARAPLPSGPGLCQRRVLVARADVAFLRYLLEAHEGLAFMHGDGTGAISLLAPESQQAALERLIADLAAEGALRVL